MPDQPTRLKTLVEAAVAMKVAALMESVARFHPLIDENKRTARMLSVLMLWINGCRHDFSTDEAFDLVVGVAAGSISLEGSAGVIASHLVKR
ncbi:type II toxin-antitoxin system death-on-curing family toxin [Arthrobacter sp. HS15c]|uniref:type II toxin-antitoxin system death-on-curing family toxin n=1 Tax=Arthrobacter sp. HS15c TaxID=3230279 RepID=UPI003466664F